MNNYNSVPDSLKGIVISKVDTLPAINALFLLFALFAAVSSFAQTASPSIEQLVNEPFLDDYYSNVVLGYKIVNDTQHFASRYVGNGLNCKNCHLESGTKKDALPLNVAGMYPKWRAKNGKRNGIGLRIRECFIYSMDGIMPPDDAQKEHLHGKVVRCCFELVLPIVNRNTAVFY